MFTMLKGQTIYVERETVGEPYWQDGLYYEGEKITTYEPLSDVFVEPMTQEDTEYLPSGLSLSDTRWLYCSHVLDTMREHNSDASYASVVYLGDPEVGKKKTKFVVWSMEDWYSDESMEMIDDSFNYIIVKEGKV